MMSINHSIIGLQEKVECDIENFIEVFFTVSDTDPNFEVFNEEPQNENLKTII